MEKKSREQYVSPQIELIQVDTEGSVMTGSLGNINSDPGWNNSVSRTRQYNAASSNDLEDLINDILTVEQ